MSYKIVLTNGTQLFELADGLVTKAHTSISLIGKNSVNFGQAQNNDLVHMLENFSSGAAPANPLIGQLWYNNVTNSLSVYNYEWQPLAAVTYSDTPPALSIKGNFWFDTTIKQLKINDGTGFNIIGPEAAQNFGTTRFVSKTVRDISGFPHAVIACTLDNEVIAIMSGDEFQVLYTNSIEGFPFIYRGMTFKSSINSPTLHGKVSSSSAQADTLLSGNGAGYVSASSSTTANSIAQRTPTGGIEATTLTASNLYSANGKMTGSWGIDATFSPTVNAGASLGTPALRWEHVYSDSFDVGSMSSLNVASSTATITDLKFVTLSDSYRHSITKIDPDATLSSASDSNLATQKAIKAYIDQQVKDAVTARITADNNLQSQISGLGLPIPSGTVLHLAGSTVPSGYLAADGAAHSIDQYYKLYIALGGISSPYGQTTTLFNVPNLSGQFIRSLGEPGRYIGTVQDSAIKAHGHLFDDIRWSEIDGVFSYNDPQLGNIAVGPGAGSNKGTDYDNGVFLTRHGTYNTGGTETRPSNIALLAIIKI
jgi:hypothetical protein